MSKLSKILNERRIEIKEQLEEFKENNYSHKVYYLSNILKASLGLEPLRVDPNNWFVRTMPFETENYFVDSYIISK